MSSAMQTPVLDNVVNLVNLIFGADDWLLDNKPNIQSNSVITNSTGPSVFVRYNRDFVITVKIYVVEKLLGTKNINKFCSL